MKTKCLLIFLISIFNYNFSNGQNRTSFYHVIDSPNIKSINYRNTKTNDLDTIDVCRRMRGIVTLEKGFALIDFWSFVPTSETKGVKANIYSDSLAIINNNECITGNIDLENHRFDIDLTRKRLDRPTRVIKIPFRARTFGVATIPFRIRPSQGDVPTSVTTNLSFVGNYNFMRGSSIITHRAMVNYGYGLGLFAGLGTADIRKSTVKDESLYTADRNNVALTYGVNFIFTRNNFGLIVSSGFDNSFGKDSDNWAYQRKLWFGLGLNSSLSFF